MRRIDLRDVIDDREASVTPGAGTMSHPRSAHVAVRSAPIVAVALATCGLLAIYWQTVVSIVAIWWRSETFAHGFIVVPICLWLAWRKRETLARTPAKPWWPGLAAVFTFGAMWFVMTKADVLGLRQFALAFMLQSAIVTVVGLRVSRALLFPLAFFLFAIPVGEFLVPVLMDRTADFTVAAIRLSGVPVYREANHFMLPSGSWSIVEACSGVRYLIASVMVGTIYAALAYRSAGRRAAFVAASIVVPIVANWLRAYGIVMLGHLSNNQLAVGVDHLMYGWLFFGLVMLILFWVGSFWREDSSPPPTPHATTTAAVATAPAPRTVLYTAALATIIVGGVWKPIEVVVEPALAVGAPVLPPIAAAPGWTNEARPFTDFRPRYLGAASQRQQSFANDGQKVGLFLAFYRGQRKGQELVTSSNVLVTPENARWVQLASGTDTVEWAGVPQTVYRAQISAPDVRLDVFRLYWVHGRLTSSDYVAKALLAWSRIMGRGDDSALIVVYAPETARSGSTADALKAFVAAHGAAIEQSLEAASLTGR